MEKILANTVYSDSTLKSWKKEQLVELIRILEHNWANAENTLNIQAKNCEMLLGQKQAEIERLTEYNANLNGMCLEFIDKNAELQKQMNLLKAENTELHKEHTILIAGSIIKQQDTAKEICDLILEHWEKKQFVECDWLRVAISEKYGVEVE